MWKRVVIAAIVGWAGGVLQAEEFDFPILLPKWDHDLSFRTGAGYRDNIGLSTQSPQESAFIMSAVEFILVRLPENQTQFNFFLSGEDIRFVSSSSVDKEQTAFAQALVQTDCGSGWQVSLAAEYVYQNQVVDVSLTEPGQAPIPVEGHGILLREGVRRDFSDKYWVSIELPARRQLYRQPLDDYWDSGPKITLGRSYANKSEMSVSYEISQRAYDTEPLSRTDGTPIPDTHRKSLQQEARLTWKHHWDTHSRWRSTTRLLARQNEDNGSGYFDYTKLQITEQILFRTKNWEASAEAKVARYDYPIQTGTDLKRRRSTDLAFNFRCERRLAAFLKIFAEYDREQIYSNLELERYHVNTVKGGLNWTF